jgi:hypothetical protein
MMQNLAIQKYLKEHGIEKTILDFSLIFKIKDDLLLLKYDQIESYKVRDTDEVKDCRGIILDKNTYELKSLPFRRFFNLGEGCAEEIDWNTAKVFEKKDGSLIQNYYHNNQWNIATSGTIDALTPVNNTDINFRDLFIKAFNQSCSINWDVMCENYFNKDYGYYFELCTPYNIVVTPHDDFNVYILGIRNLKTNVEMNFSDIQLFANTYDLKTPKVYDFNNVDDILLSMTDLPYSEEGYVVCDDNFKRIKVKNPTYVAMHHLKGKMNAFNIMELVKSNEVDEFIATFPERTEEINNLYKTYEDFICFLDTELDKLYNLLIKPNLSEISNIRKEYALAVLNLCSKEAELNFAKGFFFSAIDKKVSNAREWLQKTDNKSLYNILIKKNNTI